MHNRLETVGRALHGRLSGPSHVPFSAPIFSRAFILPGECYGLLHGHGRVDLLHAVRLRIVGSLHEGVALLRRAEGGVDDVTRSRTAV